MWINGTQPALLPGYPYQGFPVPENAFPFKRLASANLLDQSATFLYHQMNGTMFAEEQWVSSLSIWKPTVYIPISIF